MESSEDATVEVEDNNVKTHESDLFEEDSNDDGDIFPKDTTEIVDKPSDSGTDIFEDVSDGEDLFESKNSKSDENVDEVIFGLDEKSDDQKDEIEDIAGIDNNDMFGSNTQQCDDLFDDDDDDEAIDSNMHGAIPVRSNSGYLYSSYSKIISETI